MSVFVRPFERDWRFPLLIAALLLLGPLAARGADPGADLLSLSVEDLLQIEVTSASKRAQRLSEAPAAVTVLTHEDIRRSGMTRIPDLLRMVPGLHVASLDSSTWAVTARGFNGQFANKLLVMIDGRSVYTPLFSGVYWDVQDLMLEDVDRIEVVRGPGGSVWGANAVNGVINIITKEAAETQGVLVSGLAGGVERASGAVRYGGALGDASHYRSYFKYSRRSEFDDRAGVDAHDDWSLLRGGFRIDTGPGDSDRLTVQGDAYGGDSHETTLTMFRGETTVRGANALARWTHTFSEETDVQVQAYYDRTERAGIQLAEERDTFDLEIEHRFTPFSAHQVVWGGGYRLTADDIHSTSTIGFAPSDRTVHLGSAFLEDRIALIENLLTLTLGTKLEYNDYSGFEYQPSARLLWRPHERHSVWGAVSRAVRSPSRAESDIALLVPNASPPPNFQLLLGRNSFDSEELLAYEVGYRAQPLDALSVDLAAYVNDYDDLRSIEPGAPLLNFPGPGQVTVPFVAANALDAHAYGVELSATWEAAEFLRLIGGYTFMEVDIHRGLSNDPTAGGQEHDTPHHQFFLRSLLDLPANLELDGSLFWVGDVDNQAVADYPRLDLRLGWRPLPGLELSLVGQNLAQETHNEYGPSFTRFPSSVPRSAYGKATWRF